MYVDEQAKLPAVALEIVMGVPGSCVRSGEGPTTDESFNWIRIKFPLMGSFYPPSKNLSLSESLGSTIFRPKRASESFHIRMMACSFTEIACPSSQSVSLFSVLPRWPATRSPFFTVTYPPITPSSTQPPIRLTGIVDWECGSPQPSWKGRSFGFRNCSVDPKVDHGLPIPVVLPRPLDIRIPTSFTRSERQDRFDRMFLWSVF
jgi:hypothetical protein